MVDVSLQHVRFPGCVTTVASVIIVEKSLLFFGFDRTYTVITYQYTVQNVIMYRKLRL